MDILADLPTEVALMILDQIPSTGVVHFANFLALRIVTKRWQQLIARFPLKLCLRRPSNQEEIAKLAFMFPWTKRISLSPTEDFDYGVFRGFSKLQKLLLSSFSALSSLSRLPSSLTSLSFTVEQNLALRPPAALTESMLSSVASSLRKFSLTCSGRLHDFPLHLLTNLETLSVYCFCFEEAEECVATNHLSKLTALTSLSCTTRGIHPRQFSQLTNLNHLFLSVDLATSQELSSLYPFRKLTHFRSLIDYAQYSEESNRALAEHLPHLRKLGSAHRLLAAGQLGFFTSLTELHFPEGISPLTTASQLTNLHSLAHLSCPPLEHEAVVRALSASASSVRSILMRSSPFPWKPDHNPLLLFTNLDTLQLPNCGLSQAMFERICLGLRSSIRFLYVTHNPSICSLRALSVCEHLRAVDLDHCKGLTGDELKYITSNISYEALDISSVSLSLLPLRTAKFQSTLTAFGWFAPDVVYSTADIEIIAMFPLVSYMSTSEAVLPDSYMRLLLWNARYSSVQLAATSVSTLHLLLELLFEARRPLCRSMESLTITFHFHHLSDHFPLLEKLLSHRMLKSCRLTGDFGGSRGAEEIKQKFARPHLELTCVSLITPRE